MCEGNLVGQLVVDSHIDIIRWRLFQEWEEGPGGVEEKSANFGTSKAIDREMSDFR
jgi:hypothetical protein